MRRSVARWRLIAHQLPEDRADLRARIERKLENRRDHHVIGIRVTAGQEHALRLADALVDLKNPR